jgi:hypothetical protein
MGVDYAWLRLDRPVSPERHRATLRPSPAQVGEALTLVSFPGGVPMKADAGGSVTEIGEGIVFTSHDAFQSSSGGPLLDELGQIVSVLGGGAADLVATPDGCFTPLVASADPRAGIERSTLIEPALQGLCDASACEQVCGAFAESSCDDPKSGCSIGSGRSSAAHAWLTALLALAAARMLRIR